MKFIVFALALVGAASANYIAPLNAGLGWGHGPVAAPAVTTYNAYNAPVVAATPVAPIVKNYVAPAVTSYAATPIIRNVVAAPAVTGYAAAPVVAGYGAAPVLGHGFGGDAFGYDLWKKKKAAAH